MFIDTYGTSMKTLDDTLGQERIATMDVVWQKVGGNKSRFREIAKEIGFTEIEIRSYLLS